MAIGRLPTCNLPISTTTILIVTVWQNRHHRTPKVWVGEHLPTLSANKGKHGESVCQKQDRRHDQDIMRHERLRIGNQRAEDGHPDYATELSGCVQHA